MAPADCGGEEAMAMHDEGVMSQVSFQGSSRLLAVGPWRRNIAGPGFSSLGTLRLSRPSLWPCRSKRECTRRASFPVCQHARQVAEAERSRFTSLPQNAAGPPSIKRPRALHGGEDAVPCAAAVGVYQLYRNAAQLYSAAQAPCSPTTPR